MVDNAKYGGLDKVPGINIKDPTTKETSILDERSEDIGFSTADATAEHTVVYDKTAGVDVQNTGVGVKITGLVINNL